MAAGIALALCGCNSNPNKPHEGALIDDKVTSQRVKAALNRAGPQFKNVHVTTTGEGTVTLSGSVNSEQDRSRAETAARSVYRVKDLQDDLQVKQ